MASPSQSASASASVAPPPIVGLGLDKQIARIPKEVRSHIFSFLRLNVSKKLTTAPSCQTYNTGFVGEAHVRLLDQAHALTEQLYMVLAVSQVSKCLNKSLAHERAYLVSKVGKTMVALQESNRGTKCLRECVDSGWYLKVLRVFFFHKPAALLNYANDPERGEGYNRTILHNAVKPNFSYISVPFVSFVLQMDRTHNLGLASHKDYYDETPLERGRQVFGTGRGSTERDRVTLPWIAYWEQTDWEQTEQLLVRHTPPQRFPLSLPPLIAQSTVVNPTPPTPEPISSAQPNRIERAHSPLRSKADFSAPLPSSSASNLPRAGVPERASLPWHQRLKNGVSYCFSLLWKIVSTPFSFLISLFRRG